MNDAEIDQLAAELRYRLPSVFSPRLRPARILPDHLDPPDETETLALQRYLPGRGWAEIPEDDLREMVRVSAISFATDHALVTLLLPALISSCVRRCEPDTLNQLRNIVDQYQRGATFGPLLTPQQRALLRDAWAYLARRHPEHRLLHGGPVEVHPPDYGKYMRSYGGAAYKRCKGVGDWWKAKRGRGWYDGL